MALVTLPLEEFLRWPVLISDGEVLYRYKLQLGHSLMKVFVDCEYDYFNDIG
jgi:hypothetical protein